MARYIIGVVPKEHRKSFVGQAGKNVQQYCRAIKLQRVELNWKTGEVSIWTTYSDRVELAREKLREFVSDKAKRRREETEETPCPTPSCSPMSEYRLRESPKRAPKEPPSLQLPITREQWMLEQECRMNNFLGDLLN